MVRQVITRITGFHTGSDGLPTRTLCWHLGQIFELPGEGIVDDRVEVVKTHWPERRGWTAVSGTRAIMVTRNFYDAVGSYWDMCLTNTHNKRVRPEVKKSMWGKWRGMVGNEVGVWRNYAEYWLEDGRVEELLVLRFEDFVSD
eukprot:CAMPEP_0118637460 /NCGR_PEP_ID=MMETSP0785-20121206/3162_1 /TAXON_ID=91992 /ORGANISM="Bolidomonas pacifica, Strain CCMP 1866" /LENGTH=142 /DNA_ID=CAMNT_0006528643 /DNA_START=986 /DNA_END=1411 /DNA_ORIENTATION=-